MNNPEAYCGYAARYGMALMARSPELLCLAAASQALNLTFLYLVEMPHMRKVYTAAVLRANSPLVDKLKLGATAAAKAVSEAAAKAVSDAEATATTDAEATATTDAEAKKAVSDTEADEVSDAEAKAAATSLSYASLTADSAKDYVLLKEASEKTLRARIKAVKQDALREVMAIYTQVSALRTHKTAELRGKQLEQQQATSLRSPSTLQLGQDLVVHYATLPDHSTMDWVGVYPLDTPCEPGRSEGSWAFASGAAEEPLRSGCGWVRLAASEMPKKPGMYEIRYCFDGGYAVLARRPLLVLLEGEQDASEVD